MRTILLVMVLVLVPVMVQADQVFVGTLSNIPANPGETIQYDFTVTTKIFTFTSAVDGSLVTAVEDTLNGTFVWALNGTVFSHGTCCGEYVFGIDEHMAALQFGQFTPFSEFGPPPVFVRGYEFDLDRNGGHWTCVGCVGNGNRVATPEPGVVALGVAGALLIWMLWRRQRWQ